MFFGKLFVQNSLTHWLSDLLFPFFSHEQTNNVNNMNNMNKHQKVIMIESSASESTVSKGFQYFHRWQTSRKYLKLLCHVMLSMNMNCTGIMSKIRLEIINWFRLDLDNVDAFYGCSNRTKYSHVLFGCCDAVMLSHINRSQVSCS